MTHEELLAVKYNQLWEAHQRLIKEKAGLGELWEAHQRLYKENDELQKRIKSLEQFQQVLKNEKNELLKEKEQLTERNQKLTNELSKEEDNLTKVNTELAEKIKALSTERDELIASHTDKSELDLQNRRFKSAIEDLKRQNRKLEEENIALKERVGEG